MHLLQGIRQERMSKIYNQKVRNLHYNSADKVYPYNQKQGVAEKGEEKDMENNYILPFLWMRGEEEAVLREEMEKIYECGIRAVCLEARPHDDFCGPGWWHDMDIILDEAKKKDMKLWILDDKHFPTGYANGLIEKK